MDYRTKNMSETNQRQRPGSKRIAAYNMLTNSNSRAGQQQTADKIAFANKWNLISNKLQIKNNDKPKTRFTLQDRSSEVRVIPSPRLKSFPAEELRRSRPTRSCEFIGGSKKMNSLPAAAEQSLSVKNLPSQQYQEQHQQIIQEQSQQKIQQHQQKIQEEKLNSMNNKSNNKVLYFTPEMVHDQELLVTTLEQQGTNPEIIKRQFDSLLSQQRKRLFYLDQLQNQQLENEPDSTNKPKKQQRRRVSKNDGDGKPEWMARITPSWISYAVLDDAVNTSSRNTPRQMTETRQEDEQVHQNQQLHQEHYNENLHVNREIYDHQNPQGNYYYDNNNSGQSSHRYYQENSPGSCSNYNSQQYNESKCQQNQSNNENEIKMKHRISNHIAGKQKQNNGLQDSETIKAALENLKNPEYKKGFEYLEKINGNDSEIKLNGIQNPEETRAHNLNFVDIKPAHQARACANGLENMKNSNNLVSHSPMNLKNFNQSHPEYPQKMIYSDQHCAVPVIQNPQVNSSYFPGHHQIRESQSTPHEHRKVSFNVNNNEGHYQQIMEPRVIGGVQYFARKSAYMPNYTHQ